MRVPCADHGIAVGADGVATLTPSLDAWSEITAASDDAMGGGTPHVVNLLTLKKPPT